MTEAEANPNHPPAGHDSLAHAMANLGHPVRYPKLVWQGMIRTVRSSQVRVTQMDEGRLIVERSDGKDAYGMDRFVEVIAGGELHHKAIHTALIAVLNHEGKR